MVSIFSLLYLSESLPKKGISSAIKAKLEELIKNAELAEIWFFDDIKTGARICTDIVVEMPYITKQINKKHSV